MTRSLVSRCYTVKDRWNLDVFSRYIFVLYWCNVIDSQPNGCTNLIAVIFLTIFDIWLALFLTFVRHEFGIEAAELRLRTGIHERPPYRCLICARACACMIWTVFNTSDTSRQAHKNKVSLACTPWLLSFFVWRYSISLCLHIMYVSVHHWCLKSTS